MKTILITGGSNGIGYAVADKALREGCRVILLAREPRGLAAARETLIGSGAPAERISTAAVDIGDTGALRRCVAELPWVGDGLDGLVNNAAVETLHLVEDFPEKAIERIFRVNCLAPIVLIQLCLPALKRCGGSIVNVSSVADQRRGARYSVYAASKGFLNVFSKQAAVELGYQGVRINLVSPGGVDTPLMAEVTAQYFKPGDTARVHASIPMEQRWARAEEIADTIWFALSGPRYLHGADLRIDGAM